MDSVATSRATVLSALTAVSIGKKILMAVTGFVGFGFVVGHMIGNLQIFLGQDQINTYAAALQAMGPVLWVVRSFLIAVIVIHIYKGVQLKLENWSARPQKYVHDDTVQASLASRTMIWTGLIIFAFIVYHLLHFTLLWTHPEYHSLTDSLGRHDVFSMMVLGFQNMFISIFYLVAVALLTYHLSHGFASMFQTIGWNDKKYDRRFRIIGNLLAVFLFVGYASIPMAVMTGVITLPGGGI